MVPVSGGEMEVGRLASLLLTPKVNLEPYLIDRTEVTNREYAQFVRAGGYAREEFWTEVFRDGARTLPFQEAMVRFKDATGRVGPATWKLGTFPEGEDDMPVRGISWYEAAAYANYMGKQLPTLYHWYFADTGGDLFSLPGVLLPAANFQSGGPRPGSTSRAIGAFGAVNMAGNVREWISNATDSQHRLTVGGSWIDPPYLYSEPAMQSGFDRPLDAGFRCMKRLGSSAPANDAHAVIKEAPRADVTQRKPVSDAEYAIYTRLFERRQVPL
jgi:eukaryotic-like serine/threonine-protein kinase